MIVHRENLLTYLAIALREKQKEEFLRNGPNFESGLVAGLKETIKAIETGQDIYFYD